MISGSQALEWMMVSALCAAVSASAAGAGVSSVATGSFSCNVPAEISCTVVSLAAGNLDTTIVYRTGTGNTVNFSLPVALSPTAVSWASGAGNPSLGARLSEGRLQLNFPSSCAGAKVRVLDARGRLHAEAIIGPDGQSASLLPTAASGLYLIQVDGARPQTLSMVVHEGRGFVPLHSTAARSLLRAAGPAAVSAQYTVFIKSLDAGYADLPGQTLAVSEGDNGVLSFSLAASADPLVEAFKALCDSSLYARLFPLRFGVGKVRVDADGDYDFYSYDALLKAVRKMGNISVVINSFEGHQSWLWQTIRTDKGTGNVDTFAVNDTAFNAAIDPNQGWAWVRELPSTQKMVDFGEFCRYGDLTSRKNELAAFFGNISHETNADTGTSFDGGLYWREELGYQTGQFDPVLDPGYTAGSGVYQPWPGKSYHGRGPIQISYPYNYGPVSEYLFGHKDTLIQFPERVTEGDGSLAFMTAIWFWMTPQFPKPSCHAVMTGEAAAEMHGTSRFGNTIAIINGKEECGGAPGYGMPHALEVQADRIGFYKFYAEDFGIVPETDCGCTAVTPYE